MLLDLKSVFFIFLMSSYLLAGELLPVGSKAPDFQLPDAQGKIHRLSDYLGNKVVVYFYPKNGTPGCTKEACNLRDNYELLQEKKIVILGISYDDPESHQKFIKENQLPFTLLSDSEKKVAELYGTKGGLLSFIGAKRITYLIDETGKIMHVFEKVNSAKHSEQILKVLDKLNQNIKENFKSDSTAIE